MVRRLICSSAISTVYAAAIAIAAEQGEVEWRQKKKRKNTTAHVKVDCGGCRCAAGVVEDLNSSSSVGAVSTMDCLRMSCE